MVNEHGLKLTKFYPKPFPYPNDEQYTKLQTCDFICINHYYLKSLDYFKHKISRGNADSKIKHTEQEWWDENKICNNVTDTFAWEWYQKRSKLTA